MSPATTAPQAGPGRRPRVSGDEPCPWLGGALRTSRPRVSGDEPVAREEVAEHRASTPRERG